MSVCNQRHLLSVCQVLGCAPWGKQCYWPFWRLWFWSWPCSTRGPPGPTPPWTCGRDQGWSWRDTWRRGSQNQTTDWATSPSTWGRTWPGEREPETLPRWFCLIYHVWLSITSTSCVSDPVCWPVTAAYVRARAEAWTCPSPSSCSRGCRLTRCTLPSRPRSWKRWRGDGPKSTRVSRRGKNREKGCETLELWVDRLSIDLQSLQRSGLFWVVPLSPR